MASKIMNRSSHSSIKFDWKIEDFSEVNSENGLDSDVFSMGGFKWKTRVFPKGWNKVDDHLSLYLLALGFTKSLNIEVGFGVTSQTDCTNTMRKEIKYHIPENTTAGMSEGIGWPKFMLLSEFHDPAKGYIVNDTCIIRVELTCEMIEDGTVKGTDTKRRKTIGG